MRVGQTVARKAFTDCFGEHHDRVDGLTIRDRRAGGTEESGALHVRITAVKGMDTYEGPTRFFEVA